MQQLKEGQELALQPTVGTTGTGLDDIIDLIYADTGLTNTTPNNNVTGGAEATDGLNIIIAAAIDAYGLYVDLIISAADVMLMNQFIRDNYLTEWTALHGDDDGCEETGFHLIQGDDGTFSYFGGDAHDYGLKTSCDTTQIQPESSTPL